jgi:tellurite resistance protein TehA-like permease
MEKQDAEETAFKNKLQYFPISFFASVMGLSGLAIAFERYEQVFNSGSRVDFFCWLLRIWYLF